jgi:hypothetical protein
MTENKKRGRKKGSKNKVKFEGGLPEAEIIEIAEKARRYDAGITADLLKEATEIELMRSKPKTTFPDNWSGLNKIERLKWLTANR